AEKYSSENHQIKNNLGMALLRVKNYSEGWKKFESRFYTGELKRKEMPGRRWRGEIAKDKTLYVYSDQGYGDAIQFARFLKFARERVGKLIFEAQTEALPLFKDLEGVDKLCAVKPDFSTDEKYDLQCPLLSLPYALNIDENKITIHAPYIKADESEIEKWKSFFAADKKMKIGIAWKGNPVFARNELRSASIEYFTDLFSIKDASFYCLQKELTEKERATLNGFGVKTLSERFTDFSETAAAIANLDLIITTDTVIPHLAGALGKPVLLLLAFVSDWRWGTDETTAAWYPSVKIIRQKNIGNWNSVFDEVKEIVKQQYLF
ncbi:MAG: hypothetical protein GXO87_11500, partial [Chlorobi bacterium]|nr:hypothetical protein [Chlorobiota bacterium]